MKWNSLRVLSALSIMPAIYSFLVLAVSYPFIGSTDGWTRWQTAMIWSEGLGWRIWYWTDLFPPLMSLLMGLSHKVTGEYGYFTFLQLFAFSYSFSIILWQAMGTKSCVANFSIHAAGMALFLLNPFIINRTTQMFPETLLAVGLVMLATLLRDARNLQAPGFYTRLALIVCLTVGTRNNTLAVVPPLLLWCAWGFSRHTRWPRLHLLATFLSVLLLSFFVYKLPSRLGMAPSNNFTYIVMWDYVGTVLECGNPGDAYELERIAGFDRARKLYQENSIANLQWATDRIEKETLVHNRQLLYASFARLVLRHPLAYLRLKAKRAIGLMTLQTIPPRDLPFELTEYSDWGNGSPVDIEFAPASRLLVNLIYRLRKWTGFHWMFRPPFVVGLAALLLFLLKRNRLSLRIEGILFLVGILYYLTFWLVTPEITYRYFFTTYLLLTGMSWIATVKLALSLLPIPAGISSGPAPAR